MLRTTLVPLSVPLAFIALAWADFLTTRRAPRLPPPEPLALHAGEEAAMARACIALELVTASDVLRGEALDPGASVLTASPQEICRTFSTLLQQRCCKEAHARSFDPHLARL